MYGRERDAGGYGHRPAQRGQNRLQHLLLRGGLRPEAPIRAGGGYGTQRGSDQTAASLNGVLRRSGSEEILQGSKNGCVLIRKKVYGVGARRDGWSRPLPLGAPRPMIF